MTKLDLTALIGQERHKLKVVGARRVKGTKTTIYLDCQCACGAILTLRRDTFQSGSSVSCAACRSTAADLLGQKFNRLTVKAEAGRADKQVLWLVECECGRTRTAKTAALRSHQVRSCGQCGYGRGWNRWRS